MVMSTQKRFCTQCGTPADEGDRFCSACGAKLKSTASDQEDPIPSARPAHTPVPERPETPPKSTQQTDSSFAAPDRQASSAIPSRSVPSREPEQKQKKPKSKLKTILISAVIIALGWGAGKLLGGEMAKSYTKSAATATRSPIVTVAPIEEITKIPLPAETDNPEEPVLTTLPVYSPEPTITVYVPDVSGLFEGLGGSSSSYWNYLEATDDEIRDTMAYFWYGTDSSTGARCAFFSDKNAKRGGYYWYKKTSERFQAEFDVGTLADSDKNGDVLIDRNGEETPITFIPRKDGSIDFNFGSGERIKGTLRLKRDTSHIDEILNLILNYKHAVEKMQ